MSLFGDLNTEDTKRTTKVAIIVGAISNCPKFWVCKLSEVNETLTLVMNSTFVQIE